MSRSRTHYWNICHWWEEIGEDGYCWFHRPSGSWNRPGSKCIPPGEYETRRGVVKRQPRFPEWSIKSFHSGPPVSTKQLWRQKIRTMYREAMKKHPEDPECTAYGKLYAWLLWEWY